MEPDHRYDPQDLQGFVPGIGVERLREVMHELWLDRHVERAGHSGWRRVPSAASPRRETAARESQPVKPEELFDHTTFADFFK